MPEAGAGQTDSHDAAPPQDAGERPPTRWFFYGLGLSLQTLLWFLLFLAITVAVWSAASSPSSATSASDA